MKSDRYDFVHDVFEHQLGSLVQLGCSYGYFKIAKEDSPRDAFWIQFERVHLFTAVLQWCTIFGTNDNEIHWKRLVPNSDSFKAEVRGLIYQAGGFDSDSWAAYRQNILTARNKYIAHNVPGAEPVRPNFKPAFEIASEYYNWLISEFPANANNTPKSLRHIFAESQFNAAKILTSLGIYDDSDQHQNNSQNVGAE